VLLAAIELRATCGYAHRPPPIFQEYPLKTAAILPSLLVIDDDPLIREGLSLAFEESFKTFHAESRTAAVELLRQLPASLQLALVDLGLPPTPHRPDEGFGLITELLAHSPDIKIFVLSGQNDRSNARHARALGAIDFIAKPCPPARIKQHLDDALKVANTSSTSPEQSLGLVGKSSAIQAVREQIKLYADIAFPVLIEGESGSGKELVASALQKYARNSNSPFKILNCAAIAPTLIEPTLFGYCKGAFTGATSAQSGFFSDASGGTLFLDEIGELPLDMQAKLLRVLENGEYQRVGETTTQKSDARIIAATNRNLRALVKEGRFRNDLYHRLNVFSINVPPLRELGEDRLVLLEFFRNHYARQIHQTPFELTADALRLWGGYSFPGNVRELRNIVIRLTAKYGGKTIGIPQLQDEFDPFEVPIHPNASPEDIKARLRQGSFSLNQLLHEQEGLYIGAALELSGGNVSEAAKLLGINRTTLHSRMNLHQNLAG
jgi:DNA-binding NtrC family response regulator